MDQILKRFVPEMIGRIDGPMSFRLILHVGRRGRSEVPQ
jgi:hypothetical protein